MSLCHSVPLCFSGVVGLGSVNYHWSGRGWSIQDFDKNHVLVYMHPCHHTCTLFSGMLRLISEPNRVRSEISSYLWNQENIRDMCEKTMQAFSLHAQAHISAELGPIKDIKISMESEYIM